MFKVEIKKQLNSIHKGDLATEKNSLVHNFYEQKMIASVVRFSKWATKSVMTKNKQKTNKKTNKKHNQQRSWLHNQNLRSLGWLIVDSNVMITFYISFLKELCQVESFFIVQIIQWNPFSWLKFEFKSFNCLVEYFGAPY